MAEYKGIKGFKVQSRASDPTVDEGQIWYNTASNALKYDTVGAGAWAAGGSISPSIYSGMYCGTQTAGIYGGGLPGILTTSFTYNGTGWTAAPAMGTGRSNNNNAGCGTQTAAMVAGGETSGPPYRSPDTEWFNGTSWTEKANLANERYAGVLAGTQAGAICACGNIPPPGYSTLVESWDGSAWSTGTAAPQGKSNAMGGGTFTSAMLTGGQAGPLPTLDTADEWNGTSWTEVGNLNQNRSYGGFAGASGTSALVFGGSIPPGVDLTEQWNGTSWTEIADMASPARKNSGGGTSTLAITIGNESPNNGVVEEWNGAPTVVKTVTVS